MGWAAMAGRDGSGVGILMYPDVSYWGDDTQRTVVTRGNGFAGTRRFSVKEAKGTFLSGRDPAAWSVEGRSGLVF
jgi:hypothetical protein